MPDIFPARTVLQKGCLRPRGEWPASFACLRFSTPHMHLSTVLKGLVEPSLKLWNGTHSHNLTVRRFSFIPISREISPSPLCMLRQTERRTRGRNPSLSLSCKHALSVCCRTFLRRRRGGVRSNVWRRDSNCSRQYLQPFIFHF